MDNSEEIKELKDKIEKLEVEQKTFDNLSDEIKLAELIHENTCRFNHTDGCGWFYEKWSNIKDGDNSARGGYLKKAINLLRVVSFDKASEIIKIL